jgi:hypothetical protein
MCLPLRNLDKNTLEKGTHAGFEWQITNNGLASRCGYVRLLPGHPWFGKGYYDFEAHVHGGLTFAAYGEACPTHGDKDEYWIGFDCNHAWDAPDPELPGYDALPRGLIRCMSGPDCQIRTHEYVKRECERLCEQAAAAMVA